MNRSVLTLPMRLSLTLLIFIVIAMQPVAQDVPLPMPPAPQVPVDMWAVTLTPGTDPYAVAGRMGLVVGGALPGTTNTYIFRGSGELKPVTRESAQAFDSGIARSPEIIFIQQQVLLERVTRGVEDTITDPLFPNQWHLNNLGAGAGGSGTAGADANIFAAWNAGYTGTGVVVSSVDDGVWHANPDIAGNYLPSVSWDFVDNDSNPSAGGHGTSVAGVMAADNDGAACGVGAAFNAKISGLRLLNAGTDANEAAALTYANQVIDIYNNSWGPSDNGATLEAPGPLTQAALIEGITNGRGGLGSIYVWAAGNGKLNSDNANADGYANSRYTISVAATTDGGTSSWYSEHGANNLVNAPSNGGSAGIRTTANSNSGCNNSFGGTSSASPLAAGVIALMLEANPNLTWRDVQHILVQTAEHNDPSNADWFTNGAGHLFNHYYGFGRVDAGAAVMAAVSWVNVLPEQTSDSGVITVSQAIPSGPSAAFVESTFNVTEGLKVESVDVILNATHPKRGELWIELVSPSGTVSELMPERSPDSGDNYNNWRFNTVANWDENSIGTWTLRLRDRFTGSVGTFNSWRLQIHGTSAGGSITQQPQSQTVLFDESVTLTVQATGDAPFSYQWYQGMSGDTSTPVGTNSPSFTTPTLQAMTHYWVKVTGATSAMLDSDTAALTVLNAWDMLQDPTFDIKPVPGWIFNTSPWVFSSTEGKIRCDKQYVSANCAGIMKKNTTAEKLTLQQDVKLTDYPWTVRAGDTLTLNGQIKAMATGAKGNIRIVVQYLDAPKTVYKQPMATTSTWQPFTISGVIEGGTISRIFVRVTNSTVPLGVNVWIDDTQLTHSRTAVGRGTESSSGILPPPAAPDGFRGNN